MSNSTITLSELNNALENDEFIFYYQPKVSMITGEMCGAEALIRWIKPDGKIIMPSEFIPLAESSGFISAITNSMFQKLIVDISIFDDSVGDLNISINASTKDFSDSNFVEHIQNAIDKGLVEPQKIGVELTESSLLEECNDISLEFSTLRAMGVSLVMDDFGTGFSSIDILSKFPFTTIKLDQGVISRMEHSDKDNTIVGSSIRMGHELEIEVVAEGIESEEVYLSLQNAGCTIGQGYWISHPLPLIEFIELAKQRKRWPSTPAGLLYMAQLDHIHWRKSLIDGVLGLRNRSVSDTSLRGRPVSNAKSCSLGKWYNGSGKIFAGTPSYDALEKPHAELHELGDELILAVERQDSESDIMDMMREISRLSGIIIQLLQDIEHETCLKGMIKMHRC